MLVTSSSEQGKSCSSISSVEGVLEFYINDTTVWGADHNPLPNGNGLYLGDDIWKPSIIIPNPTITDRYFIVSNSGPIGGGQNFKLVFSEIDQSLNGGIGDIPTNRKNKFVEGINSMRQFSFSITATHHQNDTNFWVVAHQTWPLPAKMNAYLVTDTGITAPPIESTVPFQNGYGITTLKFSPSGQVLAGAVSFRESPCLGLLLMHFNRETGVFTEPIYIPLDTITQFGTLEFNPCGNTLVLGTMLDESLITFDLSTFDSAAIALSADTIVTSKTSGIELGIDGIIYRSKNTAQDNQLSRYRLDDQGILASLPSPINFPTGVSAGIVNQIGTMRYGLITPRQFCVGTPTEITLLSCVDTANWFIVAPSSNDTIANFSGSSIVHEFESYGTYYLHLELFKDNLHDRVIQTICVNKALDGDETQGDTLLCETDSILVDLSDYGGWVQWSDGSNAHKRWLSSSGTYSYQINNRCGEFIDSFRITTVSPSTIDLGEDSTICEGDSILLKTTYSENSSFEWSTGSMDSIIYVSQQGDYILSVTNLCGQAKDTISITVIPLPTSELPNDTIFCSSFPVNLNIIEQQNVSYQWSDGIVGATRNIDDTGSYTLYSSNTCLTDSHRINISNKALPSIGFLDRQKWCEGDTLFINTDTLSYDLLWNTGQMSNGIEIIESGTYSISILNPPCSLNKEISISLSLCNDSCKLFIPNVITPNHDGVNDVFRITSNCSSGSVHALIYNRWGQEVYNTEEVFALSNTHVTVWDGYSNGELVTSGTYYYSIQFSSEFNDQILSGSFMVQN